MMFGFILRMLKPRDSGPVSHGTLHGVDLGAWNLVGYTTISYTIADGVNLDATVFGFCAKDDIEKRFFKIISHDKTKLFNDHGWIVEHASLWEIGELPIWEIARSKPSKWLRDHMIEEKGLSWDEDSSWWISTHQNIQAIQNSSEVKNGNVVVVDFTNKER